MLNLYCVRDEVAKRLVCTFTCENDGLAVRENAKALSAVAPLGDLTINFVGEVDEATLEVTPQPHRVVSWESYKFPESPLKPIQNQKESEVKNK